MIVVLWHNAQLTLQLTAIPEHINAKLCPQATDKIHASMTT